MTGSSSSSEEEENLGGEKLRLLSIKLIYPG